MKKPVKSAHTVYIEHLEKETEMDRKKERRRKKTEINDIKREEGKGKAAEKEEVSC